MPRVTVITCTYEDSLEIVAIYMNALRAKYEYLNLVESVLQEEDPAGLERVKREEGGFFTLSLMEKLKELYESLLVDNEDDIPIYEMHEGLEISQ